MTINAAILNAQNKVINIILLESLDQVEGAVDALDANIGDTWTAGGYIKPETETLAEKRARIWEDIKRYRDNQYAVFANYAQCFFEYAMVKN